MFTATASEVLRAHLKKGETPMIKVAEATPASAIPTIAAPSAARSVFQFIVLSITQNAPTRNALAANRPPLSIEISQMSIY
jgi:hypothetical protein